jgi:hypothetical protein
MIAGDRKTIATRYSYDPYGRRTKVSGTVNSDIGFTGHYWLANSGLYPLRRTTITAMPTIDIRTWWKFPQWRKTESSNPVVQSRYAMGMRAAFNCIAWSYPRLFMMMGAGNGTKGADYGFFVRIEDSALSACASACG